MPLSGAQWVALYPTSTSVSDLELDFRTSLNNFLAALTVEGMDLLLRFGTAIPAMWFPARFRADWLAPASLVLMTAVFLAGAGVRWSPRFGGFWPPAVVLALLVIFGVTFA